MFQLIRDKPLELLTQQDYIDGEEIINLFTNVCEDSYTMVKTRLLCIILVFHNFSLRREKNYESNDNMRADLSSMKLDLVSKI